MDLHTSPPPAASVSLSQLPSLEDQVSSMLAQQESQQVAISHLRSSVLSLLHYFSSTFNPSSLSLSSSPSSSPSLVSSTFPPLPSHSVGQLTDGILHSLNHGTVDRNFSPPSSFPLPSVNMEQSSPSPHPLSSSSHFISVPMEHSSSSSLSSSSSSLPLPP